MNQIDNIHFSNKILEQLKDQILKEIQAQFKEFKYC